MIPRLAGLKQRKKNALEIYSGAEEPFFGRRVRRDVTYRSFPSLMSLIQRQCPWKTKDDPFEVHGKCAARWTAAVLGLQPALLRKAGLCSGSRRSLSATKDTVLELTLTQWTDAAG